MRLFTRIHVNVFYTRSGVHSTHTHKRNFVLEEKWYTVIHVNKRWKDKHRWFNLILLCELLFHSVCIFLDLRLIIRVSYVMQLILHQLFVLSFDIRKLCFVNIPPCHACICALWQHNRLCIWSWVLYVCVVNCVHNMSSNKYTFYQTMFSDVQIVSMFLFTFCRYISYSLQCFAYLLLANYQGFIYVKYIPISNDFTIHCIQLTWRWLHFIC